ncbi:sugar O-acetyltransferase [Jannaschia helgolandensis]|nr:sugar O-acetyltransferase [Jannaschia helgolandensis]
MAEGQWYSCLAPELEAMRVTARAACHSHATLAPDRRGAVAPMLARLFANIAEDCFIEAPFHCSYGVNTSLGASVYLNAGCVILDSGPVSIGRGTMCGPGVQIYTADHHRDPAERAKGIERALPVTIGADVWVGGGAIILPGVTVGAGAIIGAGSVVTRDVMPGTCVLGNPARAR